MITDEQYFLALDYIHHFFQERTEIIELELLQNHLVRYIQEINRQIIKLGTEKKKNANENCNH